MRRTRCTVGFTLPWMAGDAASRDSVVFRGRVDGSGPAATIRVSLRQGGVALPISLSRSAPARPDRPQEPRPPFPYRSEQVPLPQRGGRELGRHPTVPEGDGPFTAVLLLTGSGPHDRDETDLRAQAVPAAGRHPDPRRVRGLLRADDRGVGGSSGAAGRPPATTG